MRADGIREGRDIWLRAARAALVCTVALTALACGRGPVATPTAIPPGETPSVSPSPGTGLTPAGLTATASAVSGDASRASGSPTATPAVPVVATATPGPRPATPVPSATPLPTPAARGGALRTAIPLAPSHYDLHQDASPALAQWGPGIVYSRLLRFRTDPRAEAPNGEIECDLCESWLMVSPTEYQVHLRDGVNWQDLAPLSGRPLNARDVVFSLRRQSTPGWPNAPLLAPVKDVAAIDNRTVSFTLTRPDAEFLSRLADGHSRIVAPEAVAVTGDLLAGPVVGTGPWQLLEASESGFRYVANPGYFEAGVPYVDFLQVSVLAADDVRSAALRTRTLDFVSTGATELGEALARFPELRWSKTIEPGSGLEVALNTSIPPFDSLDVRRTVFLAMDPWRDVDEVWRGGAAPTPGLPVPAVSWLPPMETLQRFLAHPEEAAAQAAGAGIAPGIQVEITVGEFGPQYVEHASRIAEDLARIGFRPAFQRVTTRRFGDEVWFGGKYQMFVGAQPPVSSLSDYLLAVHHSRGAWNTARYRSAELDALIEEQSVESDPLRRRELIMDIQVRILEGAYRFSPATLYTHWAWWPGVQGFVPNTYRGESYFLARTWLSTQ